MEFSPIVGVEQAAIEDFNRSVFADVIREIGGTKREVLAGIHAPGVFHQVRE
jgi:hypothetical protein